MPIPSERARPGGGTAPRGKWAPHTATPKRSVFGNYQPAAPAGGTTLPEPGRTTRADSAEAVSLPAAKDLALARAFLYRFLAHAYADPTPAGWQWLGDAATQASVRSACAIAPTDDPPPAFPPEGFASFLDAYLAAFGHAARGSCPLNEIEYGDLKADPLFQPHRLADLAAFYRAAGLEIVPDAGERQDHLCLELEFLCVLAAKEAYALEHQLGPGPLAQCRDTQRAFLREHLGRWTPAFTRQLAASTGEPALRELAAFTRSFIESECARFGVPAGSQDLVLRPVDDDPDLPCSGCGISNLPPGATNSP